MGVLCSLLIFLVTVKEELKEMEEVLTFLVFPVRRGINFSWVSDHWKPVFSQTGFLRGPPGVSQDIENGFWSSLHWLGLGFLYALFVQWSILAIKLNSSTPHPVFHFLSAQTYSFIYSKHNVPSDLTLTFSDFSSSVVYSDQLFVAARSKKWYDMSPKRTP